MDYQALINSDRVSQKTRDALTTRAVADSPAYAPVTLNLAQLNDLRALLDRVIPQTGSVRIDLAARIDHELGRAVGDGWRRAELPPDAVAYRSGLATLTDQAFKLFDEEFARLDAPRQDALLHLMCEGRLAAVDHGSVASDRLSANQMQAWFADVRADAVRLFVAHPRTLAALGYSGIANGGDGAPKTGFVRIGVGEREPWEPVAFENPSR